MMIRRTIAFFVAAILSMGMLSACTPSEVVNSSEEVHSEESLNPASAPTTEPMASPPVDPYAIVPVWDTAIDTTKFKQPVIFERWSQRAYDNGSITTFVVLVLDKDDWFDFLDQAGVDQADYPLTLKPLQVALDNYTADSLYGIDQMAEQVMAQQDAAGLERLDPRTTNIFWSIDVYGLPLSRT